jgi:hypothetical protein
MTTLVNTDLEIEEAMDELDEEEMTPINEGVSELIDDLNLSEDWFYSVRRRRSRSVEEEQDPVEELQNKMAEAQLFSESEKVVLGRFKNPMPRKGKDETFDELVVQLGLQSIRTYASTQWRNFRLDTRGALSVPSFDVDATRLLKGLSTSAQLLWKGCC